MKLAVIASHPVQYQAPLFRRLAAWEGLELVVFYAFLPDSSSQGEGFGVGFQWDIPLLEGYPHKIFAQGMAAGGGIARLPGAFFRLRQGLLSSRPDAILCTGWHHPAMVAGIAAAASTRRPLLLRCEANLLRDRPRGSRIFHRAMLSLYDAALPIGVANRRYFSAFGIRQDQMFDSPYSIENRRFADAAAGADRAALRARWGIPPDAFCFLFAGKLVEKKHPATVVEAMRGLPGTHLLVVGSGALEASVRAAAETHRVGCSFAGFLNQSEIPAAYAAADCLVLPSDAGETWGLVVNEAMACGLPAIVSDRVGCREDLIIDGETGLSFPFGNTAALAEMLRALASAPGLAREMGSKARSHIQRWSVDNAAAGIVQAARAACADRN
ncbi:MAG: glycosyltransferase family 4 protein [Verrucomicrobiae bacterium]